MEKECYNFVSNVMIALLATDKLNTYDFLTEELDISRRTVSEMKQGKDIRIYYYIITINFLMDEIHLHASLAELLKQIRITLEENKDLVIGTIPHKRQGRKCVPEEWVEVLKWENV
ncbi:hypothetical protein [Bacteroides congonensis]|uniref:hypothetical protein n=1 Tax=Bacteroides congonensis TaxID=1871006 RepID=UPI00189DFAA7|nr:hypothetical protein [Bacteroides congonensis]